MGQYLLAQTKCFTERTVGQKGQGMVEYALILAFVVVLAIALTDAGGISEKIKAVFTKVGNQLS